MVTAEATTAPCRTVSAPEAEHFKENGWVKLEGFVAPDVLALLLSEAKRRMGEDGDSNYTN